MEVLVVFQRARVSVLLELDEELEVEQFRGNDRFGYGFAAVVQAHLVQHVDVATDDSLERQQAKPDLLDQGCQPLHFG